MREKVSSHLIPYSESDSPIGFPYIHTPLHAKLSSDTNVFRVESTVPEYVPSQDQLFPVQSVETISKRKEMQQEQLKMLEQDDDNTVITNDFYKVKKIEHFSHQLFGCTTRSKQKIEMFCHTLDTCRKNVSC